MFDNKMGFGVYYSQDNRMPPVKPIWKSSKSCNKLPLGLKSGGDVRNAKDGVMNIGSRSCLNYKNHVEVDVKYKIIRTYKITDASVHDGNVFEDILDNSNIRWDVYADRAYRSAERKMNLKENKFQAHLQRKGCNGHPLTSWEKQGNRTRAKVHSRIEHVFGAMKQRAKDVILKTVGIKKAEVKLGLRNIAYNMERFCFFDEADRIKGGLQQKKQSKSRLFLS
ncbi:MAG TPA: hypothetical protein DE060_07425 [Lentisphaeria bacterium]|nr:hypothetical protein [Lentisphaeria bacterium]HCG49020.1 hypothetical protein [Lentisphaeria bacterium]